MKRITLVLVLLAACGTATADPAEACREYADGDEEGQELLDWYSELIDMAPEGEVKDAFFAVYSFVDEGDFDSPDADAAWGRLADACAAAGVTFPE